MILATLLLSTAAPITTSAPLLLQDAKSQAQEAASKAPVVALLEEYEAAMQEWSKSYRTASAEEREGLMASYPDPIFLPRFRALADAGHARAMPFVLARLWSVEESEEAKREMVGVYLETLAAGHVGAEWTSELIYATGSIMELLGREASEEMLVDLFTSLEKKESQASGLFMIADFLSQSDDSAADAIAYFERVGKEYPDSFMAKRVEGSIYRTKHLRVGKTAPSFSGADVDGVEVSLDEFKGKVTLIDFWGFW